MRSNNNDTLVTVSIVSHGDAIKTQAVLESIQNHEQAQRLQVIVTDNLGDEKFGSLPFENLTLPRSCLSLCLNCKSVLYLIFEPYQNSLVHTPSKYMTIILSTTMRRLRPVLFPKNSTLEYWARRILAGCSNFLSWKRSYQRWQKHNEADVRVTGVSCSLHYVQWQPGKEYESIQQQLTNSQAEWILIASVPLCRAEFALQEISSTIRTHQQADLIYSDGDWQDWQGKRTSPWMKPAFGIDSLRSFNYIIPFFAVRKSLGDYVGWLCPDSGAAWAEDLVWRIVEQARQIIHIPRVLYHRINRTQQDQDIHHKDAKKALRRHLERVGLEAKVEDGPQPLTYHLSYSLQSRPLVSIIIPNHELAKELYRCVKSILEMTTYQRYEVLVVENNSQSEAIFLTYKKLQAMDDRIRLVVDDQDCFNYAAINNQAVRNSRGDVLLFLNNDTEVISPDWLERMLEYVQRLDVGAVGAKLYYPKELIQHVGIIVGMYGAAGHSYSNFPRQHPGYHCSTQLPQNYSAVTAACLMARRSLFEEVGGFDPSYRLAYNDVDLCMKIRQRGYNIVWTPHAQLYHYETMTRGYDSNTAMLTRARKEEYLFSTRWQQFLEAGDPYYSPNLALDRGYYSLRPGKCDPSPRSMPGLGGAT